MRPLQWQRAIRDSELDATAKGVAWALSTYMDNYTGKAEPGPGKETLSRVVGVGKRTVDYAINRIALAGYLGIKESPGGKSNTYIASIPTVQLPAGFSAGKKEQDGRRNERKNRRQPCSSRHSNPADDDIPTLQPPAPELKKQNEERRTTSSFANATEEAAVSQKKPCEPRSLDEPIGYDLNTALRRAFSEEKPGSEGAVVEAAPGGAGTNGTHPHRVERSLHDGSLLWSPGLTEEEKQAPDEAFVLAECDALVDAGVATWVDEKPLCGYPAHRSAGADWANDAGRKICGICHSPVRGEA